MEEHFEFVEKEPIFGFLFVQVVIAVSSCVTEGFEVARRIQQEASGGLGINHACIWMEEKEWGESFLSLCHLQSLKS